MKGIMETIKGRFNSKNFDQGFVMMRVSDINTHGDITNIFHVKTELVDKIAASMMEHGYDTSQPLVIGKIKDIGDFLADGHTRLEAAKRAGLDKIPVEFKNFDSIEDAQHYTFARQAERRNLTDQEILIAARLLPKKQTRDGSGRSVEIRSRELGISASKLIHAKTVAEKAGEDVLESIKKGKTTINQAYQKIKTSKPKNKSADKPETREISTPLTIENDTLTIFKNNEESSLEIKEIKEVNTAGKEKREFRTDSPVVDDKPPVLMDSEESTPEIQKTKEVITVNINDVLRLLVDNKELSALNIILKKYRNSISTEILLELKL